MKIKKITAVTLVVIMLSVLCAPVGLAGVPEANAIITQLQDIRDDFASVVFNALVADAVTWLSNAANADLIDASMVTEFLTHSNAARSAALLAMSPGEGLSDLSDSDALTVLRHIALAADAVGMDFSYDIVADVYILRDGSGAIISRYPPLSPPGSSSTPRPSSRTRSNDNPGVTIIPGNPIKQTGMDINIIGLVAFALIAVPLPVLAFVICIAKRRAKRRIEIYYDDREK